MADRSQGIEYDLFLIASTVGVFVCILVLLFGNRAEVAAGSLVTLMLLHCGVYYPVSVPPALVRALAEIIPLAYFLEYFRFFYGFPPSFLMSLSRATAWSWSTCGSNPLR